MDGHFVPNISFGMPTVKGLAKHTANFSYSRCNDDTKKQYHGAFLDCHLMVTSPSQWLPVLQKIGIHGFTFHLEAVHDEKECIELLQKIKSFGITAGLAIKPKTPISAITPHIAEYVDQFLVMTVEPGFGGQQFMNDMMPKVTTLRKLYPTKLIQVDGGLDTTTIHAAAKAGANVIVSGSGVFGAQSPAKAISQMREVVELEKKSWNKEQL
mgnify:CR=1 FL=1